MVQSTWMPALNDLAGALFLLTAVGLVVVRQVQACLAVFVLESVLLGASALILGTALGTPDLLAVGLITIGVKAILLPWLLRRTVSGEIYTHRELSQLINVPASLLIALGLTVAAYLIAGPLLSHQTEFVRVNLPIGLAGLLLGAFTLVTRREAVPQLIGLLAMENGAFLAGVSIAPGLPLIAELAASFDVLVIVLVMGILTQAIHEHVGTTDIVHLVERGDEGHA